MTEWVLPDEPRPVRLMNTIWADRTGVHDDLASASSLRAWLSDVGLPADAADDIDDADLAQAVALRDALRRLAALVTSDDRARAATGLTPERAVATANTALAHVPATRLGLDGHQVVHAAPPSPPDARQALAVVAAEGADLLTGGTALRACDAPGCVLYFVKDHPRRAWCSLGCGNRARAARHYARHRAP